jgi:hypothetical protein
MPKSKSIKTPSSDTYAEQFDCACGRQFFIKGNSASSKKRCQMIVRLHLKVCEVNIEGQLGGMNNARHMGTRDRTANETSGNLQPVAPLE